MSNPTHTPPGWYPDPAGGQLNRWWDGTNWSENTQPALQPYSATVLTAPSGANPTTPWAWVIAIWPLWGIINTVASLAIGGTDYVTSTSGDLTTANFVSYGITIVTWLAYPIFSFLDSRELKAREVPQPFGWGWGFIPIVYVIGRAVVVYRRTHRGLAPLFVWIGAVVLNWIVTFVIGIAIGIALYNGTV